MNERTSSTKDRSQPLSAWAVRLAGRLQNLTGAQPVIRKVATPGIPDDGTVLWWKASGEQAVWIGTTEADAAVLAMVCQSSDPSGTTTAEADVLKDLLERSWGNSGELFLPGQAHGVSVDLVEAYECQFGSGESVRFLVNRMEPLLGATANLEMLMDIELPITLRFGSAQMSLENIIGLNTGSVIELDRSLDEPIDVMVNGHLVARGEAVTLNGVYGIRISEIASRRERLNTSILTNSSHGEDIV